MTADNPSQPFPDQAVEPGVVLHLIHGTWSDGGGWVAKGTPFRNFLEKEFGDAVRINPIAWKSDNRDAERREANARVVDAVRNAGASGARQFLIGHSHEGNVAAYAATGGRLPAFLHCAVGCRKGGPCRWPRQNGWEGILAWI